jgi:hypothetical protein
MFSLSLNVGITTARSAVFRSLSFASKIIFSYQASPKFGVKTHPISGVNVIAGLGGGPITDTLLDNRGAGAPRRRGSKT